MTTDPEFRERPTREEVERLPPFVGLPLARIQVLRSPAQFEAARQAIAQARFVGFDTESRPTFTKDAVRSGPHVIQFALRDSAFIVQLNDSVPFAFLKEVIESQEIVKVGFGLRSDRGPLHARLGLQLGATVELSHLLRSLRFRSELGVKAAVAVVLGQRMQKQKSVTTSNWALPELTPKQLVYAANDAYAALEVFHAMGAPWPLPGPAASRGPSR